MNKVNSSRVYHVALVRAEYVLERICKATASLSGALILAIAVITSYEVVMRYFFGAPSIWPFEYSWIMLVIIIYLGTGYTEFERGHIRVDILYNFLSPRAGTILDTVCSFVALAYCSLLTLSCLKQALFMYSTGYSSGSMLATPLAPVGIMTTIGVGFLTLAVVAHIRKNVSNISKRRSG